MPSTYTSNLGIELPADGEQDGVWGDVVNDNMNILDRAINGSISLSLSGTSSTLTTSDGVLSNGQYKALILGGSPSGTHTITIAPDDAQKIYYVYNLSGQSVVLSQGSGTTVTVATGDSALVYSDGGGGTAGVVNLTDHFAMSSVKITGQLGLGGANYGTAGQVVVSQGAGSAPVWGSGFPSGGIIIWSGSSASIPSGWFLCDGANSTPDLRDRFIVGAGSTYAVGATGGQNSITSVPAHTHGVGNLANSSEGTHAHNGATSTDGAHSHTFAKGTGVTNNFNDFAVNAGATFSGDQATSNTGAHSHNFTTANAGAHTHSISGNTSSTGNASVDVRPPYYALCYIMKA